MQGPELISVKLHVNAPDGRLVHIRRFGFCPSAVAVGGDRGGAGGVRLLRQQIAQGEKVDARAVGPLQYTDDEGSIVTIVSDDDLGEALRLAAHTAADPAKVVLRLIVTIASPAIHTSTDVSGVCSSSGGGGGGSDTEDEPATARSDAWPRISKDLSEIAAHYPYLVVGKSRAITCTEVHAHVSSVEPTVGVHCASARTHARTRARTHIHVRTRTCVSL
jgi:hypothetical protein